jgi:hypothetical protein
MHGLAKLTRLEAKVLFLRDPVTMLVALAVPLGILLVFGLPGFARDPAPELGASAPSTPSCPRSPWPSASASWPSRSCPGT